MKAKFKTYNKGRIGQKFANKNDIYAGRGGLHTGVDTVLGWNKPVVADNAGLVYKTITSDQSHENWQAVYMLVPHDDHFIEIVQGHFNKILVEPGETIPEGAVIGLEGNKGFVFQGGVQITPEMQHKGDQRGTHTHTSYRPVRLVQRRKRDEYYLQDRWGNPYRNGGFYEIINRDVIKGYVDPFNYLDNDDNREKLTLLSKLWPWVRARLFK